MLTAIPVRSEAIGGVIDTRRLIATLARQWPCADDASRKVLEQLARRLAISKQLDESYTAEWRREATPRELVARDQYYAATVLLAFAFALDDDICGHGESLHLLNGALFAREGSAGMEPKELAIFDRLCMRLIERCSHG
jgi:hypothetical protein